MTSHNKEISPSIKDFESTNVQPQEVNNPRVIISEKELEELTLEENTTEQDANKPSIKEKLHHILYSDPSERNSNIPDITNLDLSEIRKYLKKVKTIPSKGKEVHLMQFTKECIFCDQHFMTGQQCVILKPRPNMTNDSSSIEDCFTKEIQLLQEKIVNPGIPKIITSMEDETGKILMAIMEYRKGETLKEILKNNKNIKTAEAFEITLKITRIIRYLHTEKKIVHRDIKPANIIVNWNKESKEIQVSLLDLGASSECLERDQFLTILNRDEETSDLLYTDPTIFKEEKSEDKKYEMKCDIFSLGIILHEILHGEHIAENQKDQLLNGDELHIQLSKNKLGITYIRKIYEDLLYNMLTTNVSARFDIQRVETELVNMKEIQIKTNELIKLMIVKTGKSKTVALETLNSMIEHVHMSTKTSINDKDEIFNTLKMIEEIIKTHEQKA